MVTPRRSSTAFDVHHFQPQEHPVVPLLLLLCHYLTFPRKRSKYRSPLNRNSPEYHMRIMNITPCFPLPVFVSRMLYMYSILHINITVSAQPLTCTCIPNPTQTPANAIHLLSSPLTPNPFYSNRPRTKPLYNSFTIVSAVSFTTSVTAPVAVLVSCSTLALISLTFSPTSMCSPLM